MRINVTKGCDALGLAKYILDPTKQQEDDVQAGQSPILSTNMFGRNPTELAEEFRFSHDLNTRVSRTMTHYSISLAPGEQVEDETKVAIARDLLSRMGHQHCQYFIATHHDQEHKKGVQHWHICTSSVDIYGKWVPDHFNYNELKHVERELEVQYALRYCPPKEKGERANLTSGEKRLEERTGKPCTKRLLWQAIDQATEDRPLMGLMLLRLKAKGLVAQFCEFEDGGKGLKFGAEGKYFKGRDLGARYSFEGLQQYAAIGYVSERDDLLFRELNTLSPEQCQEILELSKLSGATTSKPPNYWQQFQVWLEQNRLMKLEEEQEQEEKKSAEKPTSIENNPSSNFHDLDASELEKEQEIKSDTEQEMEWDTALLAQPLVTENQPIIPVGQQQGTRQYQDTLQQIHFQTHLAQQEQNQLRPQTEDRQETLKEPEKQTKREQYLTLYQHYCPPQPSDKPSERIYQDIAVAVRAFQDNQLPQDVLLIVANGVNAQELKQKQGEEAAVLYSHEIRKHAQLKLEELQKQQDKKRKQDTER